VRVAPQMFTLAMDVADMWKSPSGQFPPSLRGGQLLRFTLIWERRSEPKMLS
jgi:hypothetical protein